MNFRKTLFSLIGFSLEGSNSFLTSSSDRYTYSEPFSENSKSSSNFSLPRWNHLNHSPRAYVAKLDSNSILKPTRISSLSRIKSTSSRTGGVLLQLNHAKDFQSIFFGPRVYKNPFESPNEVVDVTTSRISSLKSLHFFPKKRLRNTMIVLRNCLRKGKDLDEKVKA